MKIFLLPPPDWLSALAPPNVNEGADPTYACDSLCAGAAAFWKTSSTAAGFCSTFWVSGSRAGAGALAAPETKEELATDLLSPAGEETGGFGITGVASAAL